MVLSEREYEFEDISEDCRNHDFDYESSEYYIDDKSYKTFHFRSIGLYSRCFANNSDFDRLDGFEEKSDNKFRFRNKLINFKNISSRIYNGFGYIKNLINLYN